jgi:hypothetical protein
MAFNVGNFVKDTAKSAVGRLVDKVLGNVTPGLPMNAQLTADSTAKALFNIGASYESVEAFASRRTDSIISGAADEFFAIAGKSVDRAAGASIADLRRSSTESVNNYLQNVNPSTKIKSKRSRDEYEVLAVQ